MYEFEELVLFLDDENNEENEGSVGYIMNFNKNHWIALRKVDNEHDEYRFIDSLEDDEDERNKIITLDDFKEEHSNDISEFRHDQNVVIKVIFKGEYIDLFAGFN